MNRHFSALPRRAADPAARIAVCAAAAAALWATGVRASGGEDAPAPTLTIEAAIATAFAHNRALARGQLQILRRETAVQAARGMFEPVAGPVAQGTGLGGDAQWTYGFEISQPTVLGTRLGVAATATERGGGMLDERTISIDVRQPLFRRFGRLAQEEPIAASLDQYRAERRSWELQRADLVFRLVELLDSLARLDDQIAAEANRQDRVRRLAALMTLRERQGSATRVDVLRMEQSAADADAQLAALRERRESLARELGDLLGGPLPPGTRFEPPPAVIAELPEGAAAAGIALSNRLDLAQAEDDAVAARRQGRLARRSLWPDLSLHVSLRHTWFDLPAGLAHDDRRADWFAGLSFDGYPWLSAERAARRQAELAEVDAEAAVGLRRETIVRQAQDAVALCRRARAEAAIAERNRAAARAQHRLASRLHDVGRADAFALFDGEARSAAADRLARDAESAMRLSTYALLHTLGTLIEHPDELKPGRR